MIPGRLAVGLHEVRVAARRLVQRVERLGLELDLFAQGRRAQGEIGGDPVEPVDALVTEQPLRVRLRRGQQGRQVRQPGADHDQRRAGLGQLVAGGAQRRDVVRHAVLHLVDEQRDAAPDVGGDARRVGEQFDEVDLDVTGVGSADRGRHVDARLPSIAQLGRLAGPDAERERLQYAEKIVDPVRRAVVRGQLADGHVQGRRDRPAQRLVGPGLDLAGAPEDRDRLRAQRVEQHGLADAAQAGEDEGALGPPARHPLEDDLEDLQLAVAAGELRGALAGAGRIGIANRIHDLDRIGLSSASRRTG